MPEYLDNLDPNVLNASVAPCLLCGSRDWQWLGALAIGRCWGPREARHPEVRVVAPPERQPKTAWVTVGPEIQKELTESAKTGPFIAPNPAQPVRRRPGRMKERKDAVEGGNEARSN